MVRLPHRLSLSLFATGALLAGCSHKLDESRVRAFVDAADEAFLKGNSTHICAMRTEDFRLEATSFELAKGQVMDSLADAESYDAERPATGSRLEGKTDVLNLQQFCLMSIANREFFRRASLERGELHIELAPDGRSATVRAHYIVKEPEIERGDSVLHDRDSVEHQLATRQTESDDESVVVIGPDGDPLFRSTRSTSKSFLTHKERDRRL